MRGHLLTAAAALGLVASIAANGFRSNTILPEVREHLELARQCAYGGKAEKALAHTLVVNLDRKIRVRVDCGPLKGPQQTPYRNALSSAFHMWGDTLGTDLFETAETGPVDVIVHFQPDVRDNGRSVAAHVQWSRGVANESTNPTVVLHADIQMRTLSPSGESLTFEQLRASLAHELGHVAGLCDSPTVGDVMGPMNYKSPIMAIRNDEVQELLKARDQALQLRRAIYAQLGSK